MLRAEQQQQRVQHTRVVGVHAGVVGIRSTPELRDGGGEERLCVLRARHRLRTRLVYQREAAAAPARDRGAQRATSHSQQSHVQQRSATKCLRTMRA
jgi:hypothetical protein